MPLLRRPYPGPYDHERRRAWPAALGALTALLVAGLIGWAIGSGSGTESATRTVTHALTAVTAPTSVYEHTSAGAVAAAQAFLYERAITPETGPLAVTNPRAGQVSGVWHLLYRVKSYSPQTATIRTYGLDLSYGYGSASLTWGFTDVDVQWSDARWAVMSDPLTIVPEGATPPTNGTTGPADLAFGELLYAFRRFPGAP
jgi:hypothetical protein